ncbi:MAG: hypothetical protein GY832_01460 [Chloroflexi bacterium]|nr:hypothetical protein [Chloroflexota bacterium]
MVATSERRKHLFDVADAVALVHAEWSESDIPYITDPFQAAVDDMVEVFSTGDTPADCRVLNKEVETLTDSWNAWKKAAEVSGDTAAMPSQDFWFAMERVAAARQDAVPRQSVRLETIKELEKQGVNDNQICAIYEWFLSDGSADLDKLREEKAKPGTHTGEGFVSPQERRRLKRQADQDAAVARARETREKKLEKMEAVAPESLEQLVTEGVSAEQIADMKNCTVEQVFADCDEAGIQRPMENYPSPQTERGTHGPEINEATERAIDAEVEGKRRDAGMETRVESAPEAPPVARPMPWQKQAEESIGDGDGTFPVSDDSGTTMTLEQHIVSLHQEGIKPGEISRTLTTEDETISRQKVNAVIKRFKQQPEAFGAAAEPTTETPVEA